MLNAKIFKIFDVNALVEGELP